MDRRNGGGQLAPPRPPKLLPRVHRPRAPSPPTMNEFPTAMNNSQTTATATATATASATVTPSSSTLQCTSSSSNNNNNNNNNNILNNNDSNNLNKNQGNLLNNFNAQPQHQQQQQQQQQPLNSIINSNNITIPTATTLSTVGSNGLTTNILTPIQSSSPISPPLVQVNQPTLSRSLASPVALSPATSNCSTPTSANQALISNSGSSGSSPYNAFIIDISQNVNAYLADAYDDYQIHHLTYLPQRPSNLNRNTSNVSTTSSTSTASSTVTAANSFTRRRPPAPPASSAASVPLLSVNNTHNSNNHNSPNTNNNNNNNNSNNLNITNNNNTISTNINSTSNINNISSNNNNNQNSNSTNPNSSSSGLLNSGLFSSFHNNNPDTAATAPLVTLAQPRPESERLTNEYVETPLRSTQQLLHVTRSVHPAGQNDNGQTTTHHPLLLPQREFRQHQHQHQQQQQQQHQNQNHHLNQQQQQQQQQLQFSSRLAGTAGSVNANFGTNPNNDELLHSHPHPQFNLQQQQQQHQQHNVQPLINTRLQAGGVGVGGGITPSSKLDSSSLLFPTTGGEKTTIAPPPPRSRNDLQPIEQPITKQPALTNNAAALNKCDLVKCGHALGELLDLHPISVSHSGSVPTLSGSNSLGTPILVGSNALLSNGATTMDLSSITCPRCHRCRCEQCKSPRPLPQTWLFNKKCLCSFETVTDVLSCNCFAKACFYHCCRDNECYDEGNPSTDNPCACYPYKRLKRFTLLGVLSTILPCLCLYWPLRGCGYLCAKCYARCAGRGCRCNPTTTCILPAGLMGTNGNLVNNNGALANENGSLNNSGKNNQKVSTECVANRKQIKDDKAPEKRLLDSSVEY